LRKKIRCVFTTPSMKTMPEGFHLSRYLCLISYHMSRWPVGMGYISTERCIARVPATGSCLMGSASFRRLPSLIALTKLRSRRRVTRNLSKRCQWLGRRKICIKQFFLRPRLPWCLVESSLRGGYERYFCKRTFRSPFQCFPSACTKTISRVTILNSLDYRGFDDLTHRRQSAIHSARLIMVRESYPFPHFWKPLFQVIASRFGDYNMTVKLKTENSFVIRRYCVSVPG
jgi:hypothetical protein